MQNTTPTRLNRQERRGRTRDELLDAAAEVFARLGYEAASLDEVAAAAGYTKGALYSNFKSKEDLFLSLIDRRVEIQAARMARLAAGEGSEGAEPPAGHSADTQPFSLDWVVLAMEFWLHAMRHDSSRATLAAQYERFRESATRSVEAAFARAGATPPMPPRDLAILIEALGTGLGVQYALDPERVDMSIQRPAIARLLGLDPFAAPAPRPEA